MLSGRLDRWLSPAPRGDRVGWIFQHDFAHRGLHSGTVPENSMAAFAAAMAGGHGIELDVQRSSDGQSVVFHDDTLERLTGAQGAVNRRSAAQLAELRLLETDEAIPTLRQVLAQVAGRVPILIEIKSRREGQVAGRCLAVRRVLEGYTGAHAVMSFDPRVARWFHRHSPHTVRGLVMSEDGNRTLAARARRRLAMWSAKPDFLACDVRDLPSRFVAAQRARGVPVATWTVRSADEASRARQYADAPIFEVGAVQD
ncbi:glycerophosphodiester phosphodiesterase family protein [Novosphingobium profundi]|uniref:glycerophosphodiester phosphodiesterase family protein n=1 Tax=Novosphingobium profundi TaxID=1774954 RepID=UPI001CFDD77F|nr:glycerophosphodiester phosphodiesterase family protein [Novosphingobium profundi]